MGDELHAVANAQHWDAGAQRLRVDLRRPGLVNARRSAREDEPGRLPAPQLRPGRRARDELAVHIRFAHAARDELAVLRTEIEHEDRLASLPVLRLRPCVRGRRGLHRGPREFKAQPPNSWGWRWVRTSPCRRAGPAAGPCPPT